MTGRVIVGNCVTGVIVCNVFVGRMLKTIKFVAPGAPLADVIAARNEPAPLSLVVVTVNVAADKVRQTLGSTRREHKTGKAFVKLEHIWFTPPVQGFTNRSFRNSIPNRER